MLPSTQCFDIGPATGGKFTTKSTKRHSSILQLAAHGVECRADQLAEAISISYCRDGHVKTADIAYSEMVASFMVTPVLMSFRTRLYESFASPRDASIRNRIMKTALRLWQAVNQLLFEIHLRFLARVTNVGGTVVLVTDTAKHFDPSTAVVAPIPSFPDGHDPYDDLDVRGLGISLVHRGYAKWRDHEHSFEVRVAGVPVNDFVSHWHDVVIYHFKRVADQD